MDAADPTFPPEDAHEREHRDDYARDYGLSRWLDRDTDYIEQLLREIDHA